GREAHGTPIWSLSRASRSRLLGSSTSVLILLLALGLSAPTRAPAQTCGNGVVEAPEQCDNGNTLSGDCCSATCQNEADGGVCDDGNACTSSATCASGVCVGSGDPRCGV